ncbi:MAG: hypothetical protein LV481_05120 [Methylacidiphilales bacterium]|nr:hypothetical protein [Candidatus Methylacidiphilales bacterium]
MSRRVHFTLMALLMLAPSLLRAQDDGPPISITSPDTAVTFAYGNIKSHTLIWDKQRQLLIAHVVFTDTEGGTDQPQDDEHEFRLPGVSFDESKGIFYAVSARGETIPVARFKKTLFFKTIEVLPNAVIHIQHPRGNVTVLLEAISPSDPAMHPPATNPDGTRKVGINDILH